MAALHRNLIAGEWVEGDAVTRNVNPSNTDDVIGEYAQADAGQTEAAIAAARSAFPRLVPHDSARAARHPLAHLARDPGASRRTRPPAGARGGEDPPGGHRAKSRGPGRSSTSSLARPCAFPGETFASVRPSRRHRSDPGAGRGRRHHPPWNFPIAIPAWKIAPALAYGNAVVFKPADLVPGSAHALAEIIERAGVAKGVFNLVHGARLGRRRGDSRQPAVDAVTFTGSVADRPARGRRLRRRHAQVSARNGRQESAGRSRRRRHRRPPSNAPSMAPFSRPGSAARRLPG